MKIIRLATGPGEQNFGFQIAFGAVNFTDEVIDSRKYHETVESHDNTGLLILTIAIIAFDLHIPVLRLMITRA